MLNGMIEEEQVMEILATFPGPSRFLIHTQEVHYMSEADTATRKIRVPTNFANFKTPEIPCNEKIPLGVDGKPLWKSQCKQSPSSNSASGTRKDLWERMKAVIDGLL